jgi:replicative superfamily II helicase
MDAEGIDQFVPQVAESKTYKFRNETTGRMNREVFPRLTHKAETAAELAYRLSNTGPVLVFCTQTNHADSVSKALLRRIELAELTGEVLNARFSTAQTRTVAIAREWLGEDHPLTLKLERGIAVHHGRIPDAIKKAI